MLRNEANCHSKKKRERNPMPQIQPLEFHANLRLKWARFLRGKSPKPGQKEDERDKKFLLGRLNFGGEKCGSILSKNYLPYGRTFG